MTLVCPEVFTSNEYSSRSFLTLVDFISAAALMSTLKFFRWFSNFSLSISILDFAFVYNESAFSTPNLCIANR